MENIWYKNGLILLVTAIKSEKLSFIGGFPNTQINVWYI